MGLPISLINGASRARSSAIKPMNMKLGVYIAFVFHRLHLEFLYIFKTLGSRPDGYESNQNQ